MISNLELYQAIEYPDYVHEFTHPAGLSAMASLYGFKATPPEGARILEIGSHLGSNLLWMARSLPKSQCLGVDLIESSVEQARESAKKVGVSNIEYRVADILDCDLGDRQFDYIVAHGFFSWVPQDVAQSLLALCRKHLAPKGIAMISYNAMPGSAARDAIRQLLLLEPSDDKDILGSGERAVEAVLGHLEMTLSTLDDTASRVLLKRHVKMMRGGAIEGILQDEMGSMNIPYYFSEFAEWAAKNGLGYVADTMLERDWVDVHPAVMRKAIVDRKLPRLKALQYSDHLFDVMFRRSMVCRTEDAKQVTASPSWKAIESLYAISFLRVKEGEDIDSGQPVQYVAMQRKDDKQPDSTSLLIESQSIQMTLNLLQESAKQALLISEVWAKVCAKLSLNGEHERLAFQKLAYFVMQSICRKEIYVYTLPMQAK